MRDTPLMEQVISSIVSPDAPVTVNEKGGAQSDVPVRFDLIDARAMFEMAKVLDHGAKKYGANNWRSIPVDDHLNHLLMHTFAYLAGDRTDDHLSHILCRATFALGVTLQDVKPNVLGYMVRHPDGSDTVMYKDKEDIDMLCHPDGSFIMTVEKGP